MARAKVHSFYNGQQIFKLVSILIFILSFYRGTGFKQNCLIRKTAAFL